MAVNAFDTFLFTGIWSNKNLFCLYEKVSQKNDLLEIGGAYMNDVSLSVLRAASKPERLCSFVNTQDITIKILWYTCTLL